LTKQHYVCTWDLSLVASIVLPAFMLIELFVYIAVLILFIRPVRKILTVLESRTLRQTLSQTSFWNASLIFLELGLLLILVIVISSLEAGPVRHEFIVRLGQTDCISVMICVVMCLRPPAPTKEPKTHVDKILEKLTNRKRNEVRSSDLLVFDQRQSSSDNSDSPDGHNHARRRPDPRIERPQPGGRPQGSNLLNPDQTHLKTALQEIVAALGSLSDKDAFNRTYGTRESQFHGVCRGGPEVLETRFQPSYATIDPPEQSGDSRLKQPDLTSESSRKITAEGSPFSYSQAPLPPVPERKKKREAAWGEGKEAPWLRTSNSLDRDQMTETAKSSRKSSTHEMLWPPGQSSTSQKEMIPPWTDRGRVQDEESSCTSYMHPGGDGLIGQNAKILTLTSVIPRVPWTGEKGPLPIRETAKAPEQLDGEAFEAKEPRCPTSNSGPSVIQVVPPSNKSHLELPTTNTPEQTTNRSLVPSELPTVKTGKSSTRSGTTFTLTVPKPESKKQSRGKAPNNGSENLILP